MPKVSVLMPVFNAEAYLAEAIESILKQSFTDFEFLIFNDGSIDKSHQIITSYSSDTRIRYINSTTNRGYLVYLNEGLQLAQGEYIARMDADDLSMPTRFEDQVKFLDKNLDYALVGSKVDYINGEGEYLFTPDLPHNDEEIKARLFFNNCIYHPSVMIRMKSLGASQYDANYYPAEDYEMWVRLARNYKFKILDDILLKYRWHDSNISKTKNQQQRKCMDRIYMSYTDLLHVNYEPVQFHDDLYHLQFQSHKVDCLIMPTQPLRYLDLLHKKNKQYAIFEPIIFGKILIDIWSSVYYNQFVHKKMYISPYLIFSELNNISFFNKLFHLSKAIIFYLRKF